MCLPPSPTPPPPPSMSLCNCADRTAIDGKVVAPEVQ